VLTRREEDIVEMENDEKNTELLLEWVEGKEGNRNVRDSGQVEGASEGAAGAVPAQNVEI
jgi:hypothetical protein